MIKPLAGMLVTASIWLAAMIAAKAVQDAIASKVAPGMTCCSAVQETTCCSVEQVRTSPMAEPGMIVFGDNKATTHCKVLKATTDYSGRLAGTICLEEAEMTE